MRSLLTLIGGAASAQLMAIAASPLLSRIFTADDFGIFAIYAGILYFLNAFSSFRLEVAALSSSVDEEAFSLIRLAFLFLVLIAAICVPLGVSVAGALGHSLLLWGILLPISVLLGGGFNILNSYALRLQNLKVVSTGRFIQSGGGVLMQLLFGFAGMGLTGLVLGQMAGLFMGGVLIVYLIREHLRKWLMPFSWAGVRVLLSVNARHMRYDSFAASLSVAANHLPLVLVTGMLGTAMGGGFFMAYRVLVIPVGVIAQSVSQLIGSRYTVWVEMSIAATSVAKVIAMLLVLTVPPFLVFGLISEDIFAFVLGEQWRYAGMIAAWCGLWMGLKFVYDSVAVFVSLSGMQRMGMYFQWLLLAFRVMSIVVGSFFLTPINTVKLFCVVSAVVYLVGILLVYHGAGMKLTQLVSPLCVVGVTSAIFYSSVNMVLIQSEVSLVWPSLGIAFMSFIFWCTYVVRYFLGVRQLLV